MNHRSLLLKIGVTVVLVLTTATTATTTAAKTATTTTKREIAGPGTATSAKASAAALHLVLSEPGALPIEPILDVSLGATRGALDQSTNEATAFAASAYPGDVLVNPLSLVSLGFAPDHIITRITKALPVAVTGWPITPWTLKAEAEYPGLPTAKKEIANTERTLPIGLQTRGSLQEASANETETASTAALDVTINSPLTAFPQYRWAAELAEGFLAPYLGAFTINLDGTFLDARGISSSTHIQDKGAVTEVTTETAFTSIDLFGGLFRVGPSRAIVSQEGDLKSVRVTRHEVELGPITVMGVRVSVSGGALRVADSRIPSQHVDTVQSLLSRIMAITGVKVTGPSKSVVGGVALASAFEVIIPLVHPKIVIVPAGTATITVGIGQVSTDLSLSPMDEEPAESENAPGVVNGGERSPLALGLVARRLEFLYTAMALFAALAVAFAGWSWRRRSDMAQTPGRTRISV